MCDFLELLMIINFYIIGERWFMISWTLNKAENVYKAPPKVKVFAWWYAGWLTLVIYSKDVGQVPCYAHIGVFYARVQGRVGRTFLSCRFNWQLWCFSFNGINVSCRAPKHCFSLLGVKFKVLGGGKKAKVIWGCMMRGWKWRRCGQRFGRLFLLILGKLLFVTLF